MIKEADKQVLGLQLPTDPRWATAAEESLQEILTDHAYCEQKAASSCISLITLYPENEDIVNTLTPIVKEEWSHFERVLSELRKRGWNLGRQRKDEYVNQLPSITKKGGSRDQQLVEKLLINALIEARSCERFRQLHQNLSDPSLKDFYYKLMISEAGHYRTFIDLAENYESKEYVRTRWEEILKGEAEIVIKLPARPDRMH